MVILEWLVAGLVASTVSSLCLAVLLKQVLKFVFGVNPIFTKLFYALGFLIFVNYVGALLLIIFEVRFLLVFQAVFSFFALPVLISEGVPSIDGRKVSYSQAIYLLRDSTSTKI